MKISEILTSIYKEEIPFVLYNGNKGYKINCINCQFFKQNEKGRWLCTSMFKNACREEFFNWLRSERE